MPSHALRIAAQALCWPSLFSVAVIGALTACAPRATEPGIPADTDGPLTREQAELLIEEPLADLAATVSERVGEYAEFSADAPAETQEVDGPTFELEMMVQVPLAVSECAQG